MKTVDLTYLLVIGIPLLIILCVIMFMIGRQSGKKYVYRMMNGGQGPYETPAEAAMRIVENENRVNQLRKIPTTSMPYASNIPGMNATTDAGRIDKEKGWFSWLGTDEGAQS